MVRRQQQMQMSSLLSSRTDRPVRYSARVSTVTRFSALSSSSRQRLCMHSKRWGSRTLTHSLTLSGPLTPSLTHWLTRTLPPRIHATACTEPPCPRRHSTPRGAAPDQRQHCGGAGSLRARQQVNEHARMRTRTHTRTHVHMHTRAHTRKYPCIHARKRV